MITAHADVVGSLLRPPELLAAQKDHAAGRLTDAGFKAVEDRAVDQAVGWQEAAGLEVVTDGEMRRLSFQSQLAEAVDGFGAWDIDAFLWGDCTATRRSAIGKATGRPASAWSTSSGASAISRSRSSSICAAGRPASQR